MGRLHIVANRPKIGKFSTYDRETYTALTDRQLRLTIWKIGQDIGLLVFLELNVNGRKIYIPFTLCCICPLAWR